MDEMAIKRMMDAHGWERQEAYRKVSTYIDFLIRDLESLKKKADWAKTAEPDERVNIYAHQLPENNMKIIRNILIDAEKHSEVLSVLNDMLPEPDAE